MCQLQSNRHQLALSKNLYVLLLFSFNKDNSLFYKMKSYSGTLVFHCVLNYTSLCSRKVLHRIHKEIYLYRIVTLIFTS